VSFCYRALNSSPILLPCNRSARRTVEFKKPGVEIALRFVQNVVSNGKSEKAYQ
jgi:hypothetical protein